MNKPDLAPLVFDRDRTDLTRGRKIKKKMLLHQPLTEAEQREWDGGLRGAFNYSDLNRLEEWTTFLAGAMAVPIPVRPGKNWQPGEAIFQPDLDRIVENIMALGRGFGYPRGWRYLDPEAPMTMKKLNDMEWDLDVCAKRLESGGRKGENR